MHFIILVGLSQTQNKLVSSCLVWYEQEQDLSNLFTHIQHHAKINAAQLRSVTEITPKAPFISENRSPIVWILCQHIIQGRIQDFFRRGCTHLLLSFNTNKPHIFFFSEYQLYSRLPVIRTFKGNRKKFKLSGVRVIEGKII